MMRTPSIATLRSADAGAKDRTAPPAAPARHPLTLRRLPDGHAPAPGREQLSLLPEASTSFREVTQDIATQRRETGY